MTKKRTKKSRKTDLPNENLTLPLEELYKYKLQLLNKELEEAKSLVVTPLKNAYEQELVKRIKESVAANEECQQAHKNRIDCINEILDVVEAELPEGYVVGTINPEEGNFVAVYNPTEVGKRLEL